MSRTEASGDVPGLSRPRLCVLMTVFNRKARTLDCLGHLATNTARAEAQVDAIVVDDGCTDGTAEAIAREFPWVRVVPTAGNLYWCRGMHRAFSEALERGYDYYLWLNDDTDLYPDAIERLLQTAEQCRSGPGAPVIVVGSTLNPTTQRVSYGGERALNRFRPLSLTLVQPGPHPQRVETFNGNIVLIDAAAAAAVGNLDPAFEHAMGDTDYGFRARRLGVPTWLAPGVHGTCSPNHRSGTFFDTRLPLGARWNHVMSRKGLPWRSWLRLTRRHAGILWPAYFVWPYLYLLITAAVGSALFAEDMG